MLNKMTNLKIIFSLITAFVISILSSNIFIGKTPRIKSSFFTSTPRKTPAPITVFFSPTPTLIDFKPFVYNTPVFLKTPVPTTPVFLETIVPTKIIPTPTLTSTPTPTPLPISVASNCPITSNENYQSMRAERSDADLIVNGPVENSPEINLRLRGFIQVNESTNLISRNGNNYGLDRIMPPQISSLYGGPIPQIIKTYRIYEWDFKNNKTAAPKTATPNFPVHMLGLAATPGQKLYGLKAGRRIGGNNVFMVLYANKKDIVFTHSNSDTLLGGYLFYFLDICVDPNLLAKYHTDNAQGRKNLPVIATGQIFGYADNSDVKVVVRDTMSFMDTRYKEDWWFYGTH